MLVISAPHEQQLIALVNRLERALFDTATVARTPLPLAGRTLEVHTDWHPA